jgi:DNA-binding beta-propeller fold protein YncE
VNDGVIDVKVWMLTGAVTLFSLDAWAGSQPPQFILEWGSQGNGPGQVSGPHGIEVDADGIIYLADTGNNRIQKFASDGTFIIQWGSLGIGPGQFNHPHGIGIGPSGHVYVAETGNNRVGFLRNRRWTVSA